MAKIVWPMKTLNPYYLAPKPFSKMVEGLDDFAWSSVSINAYTYAYVTGENQALAK